MAVSKKKFVKMLEQDRAAYVYITNADETVMHFLKEIELHEDTTLDELFTDSFKDAMLLDIDDAILLRDMFRILADVNLEIVQLSTTVEWITD